MPEALVKLAPWVAAARHLPVAFAQVREDAELDLEVLDGCPANARIAMIASGGCTAAALAASPHAGHLLLVDAQPAQMALTRLKLALLKDSPRLRAQLLGHAPQRTSAREALLSQRLERLGLSRNALGPVAEVGAFGLDFCGRYEAVFRRLAQLLDERGSRDMTRPCADAFALSGLTALFGPAATNNAVRPFHRHFRERLSNAVRRPDAAKNPYLSLMLRGRLPPRRTLPWMSAPARRTPPKIETFIGGMLDALDGRKAEFDYVHLSNILDWLDAGAAGALLAAARRSLKKGGFVLIRQLNSTLDVPALGPGFEWLSARAAEMSARDRSAIYARLHFGAAR